MHCGNQLNRVNPSVSLRTKPKDLQRPKRHFEHEITKRQEYNQNAMNDRRNNKGWLRNPKSETILESGQRTESPRRPSTFL